MFMKPPQTSPRLSPAALAFGSVSSALLAFALTPPPSLYAVDGSWAVNAAGNWNTASNWSSSPTVPGGAGSTINLNFDITAARTVTIDTTSATVGILNIGDPTTTFFAYTLAASGGASLIMDNSGAGAQINHTSTGVADIISAPISLNDNLTVSNASGSALTLSGGITSTGTQNVTFKANAAGGFTVSTASVNNSGTITNSGTGAGTTTLSGGVGSNVTAINQSSTTSALTISGALAVNSGGTTLTNTAGTKVLTASGGVTGTGNLVLNNNSALASGITLSTTSVNNTGSITNSGTGAGTTLISAALGSAVTGVTQNSSTSALTLNGVNTNYNGTTNLTAGKLSLGSATALGGNGSTTGTGGALNIAAGTTLDSSAASLALTTVNAQNWNGSFTFAGTNDLDLGTGAITLAAPLTLTTLSTKTLTARGVISGGNGIFDITKAGSGTFAYTQNIALSGVQTLDKITAGTELLSGVLSGSGAGLTVSNLGTLKLSNTNTYNGATTLTKGTLSLTGASGSIASSAVTASGGSILAIDSSTAGVTGATRTGSLTMKGTSLTVTGNSTANSVDTIGALTIGGTATPSGATGNVVTLTPNALTNAQLVASSLTRTNDGAVMFRGTGLGTTAMASPTANTSNIKFTADPSAHLVGGDGSDHNTKIIPWAVVDTSATGNGSSFATYDATNGVRALGASEYDTVITGGTSNDHNANLAIATTTTTTVNTDTTVNSLFLTTSGAGAAGILAGTGKLTVTSGAVFANFGATGLTITKQLDFGSTRGIIGSAGTQTTNVLNINGGISGSGGVTFYSPTATNATQTIILDANNGATSYTGDTIIQGNLLVKSTTGVAILPNGAAGRAGDVYIYGTMSMSSNTNNGGYALQINGLNGSGNIQEVGSNANTLIVGDNNADGNFSGGLLAGSGNFTFTKIGTGTQILSGTSSTRNLGATNIQNGTLSVVTLNSVVGGTATSSLGAPSNVANGTISLGTSTTGTGTLKVVGTGETTDRVINLAGTTAGGVIDQAGTGLLKFTTALTATGAGSKTLTLQGSTSGTGEIAAAIVNNSGTNKTSVTKAGSSTWTLSGANTYTGATTISNGTLVVSGSIASSAATVGSGATLALSGPGAAGAVTVNSGTFQLGTAGTAGAVTINDGTLGGVGTVNSLTFTGTSTFGPGNSPGTVTIADGGTFTLSSGTTSTFQFTSSGFGVGTFDLVTTPSTGTGTIAGILNLDFTGGGYADGSSVTFINLSSISGTFSTVNVTGLSGLIATVNYNNLAGDVSVSLTAIPEPSTYALFAGAGLLAYAVRRKIRARHTV